MWGWLIVVNEYHMVIQVYVSHMTVYMYGWHSYLSASITWLHIFVFTWLYICVSACSQHNYIFECKFLVVTQFLSLTHMTVYVYGPHSYLFLCLILHMYVVHVTTYLNLNIIWIHIFVNLTWLLIYAVRTATYLSVSLTWLWIFVSHVAHI